MENLPKVFIIILNYNGKDCIKSALTSVFSVDYPNFEVLVVDNNSTDGSLEMIRKNFPKVILIKNKENVGFSAGNNVGIKYSLERGAKYIMLLNYDTKVRSNFLKPLVEMMEKEEKNGIGSPVIFEGDSQKIWFSGGKIDWFRMKTEHIKEKTAVDYFDGDYITGCAMMIKAEVFEKIGLLDEDYFLYWEDADFSVRVKKAGYKLGVCAKSQVYHFEKSQEKKVNKIYWLVLSGLIFFKKNSPFWLKPWIFLYVIGRKIINSRDIKNKKNPINEAVKKAYQDFKYAK